jgi:phospholipase C
MTTCARFRKALLLAGMGAGLLIGAPEARADGNLNNVNHIIIVMQENHSFDNYFGALPYVMGGPYHGGPCAPTDHTCVDGLSCTRVGSNYTCTNSNLDDDNSTPTAFHDADYCIEPDLDHSWPGTHREVNYGSPAGALLFSPMDGFVRVNDATEQIDSGESPTDDDTIGFYNEDDLPFYYSLAQNFAMNDRYFCSVLGQTFPNRSYEVAATSFGHLTTAEIFPPPPPQNEYKPITGTIYDLLDAGAIAWKDYYSLVPYTFIFKSGSPNAVPIAQFFTDAAAGMLPPVSFVDSVQLGAAENDEHPPTDIRKGQFFVWQVINAIRNSPNWADTVIFFTYDEHGGYYDHVTPPPAPQGPNLNPDGIDPGQCADNSNPPASQQPGGGLQCSASQSDAAAICPGFTPTGPYPAACANFNQLGVRVPFVVVSPFAKPGYVSHTIGDHTSMLAFIEKRFLSSQFMTARDQNADTLEDMFDFTNSPSLSTVIPMAPAPSPTDPGCTTTSSTTTTTTSTTTTTTFGCPPSPVNGCQNAATQKGRLQLGNGKLKWKWLSSGTVAVTDFGSPTTTTNYILCLYDNSVKKLSARAPADGTCGTKPCWKATGSTGFKYVDKDGTPDGVTKETLKAGAPGHGKVQVKGSGANLQLPTLPLTTPVRVQARQSSSSTCWEATFSTPSTNTSTQFKAKSD